MVQGSATRMSIPLVNRVLAAFNQMRGSRTAISLDGPVQSYIEAGTSLFLRLEVPKDASEYADCFPQLEVDLRSPTGKAIYNSRVSSETVNFKGELVVKRNWLDTTGYLEGTLSAGNKKYKVTYIQPKIWVPSGMIQPEPQTL